MIPAAKSFVLSFLILIPTLCFAGVDGRPCSKLVGVSPVVTKIARNHADLPGLAAKVNKGEVDFRSACIYYQTHKENPAAITNMRSSQVGLATLAKDFREKIKATKADVEKALPGARLLEMKECVQQLEGFQPQLKAYEAKIPGDASYKCD